MSGERLARAIAAIDAANADDPSTIVVDGVARPKEQAHAEMMTAWVQRLDPDADDAQLLAARAHHLRRWVVPRADYPDGRAGYLRWRTAQKKRHADDVAAILTAEGYAESTIARVQSIVRKEGLGHGDPAVQTHEDALCLVFLQTQFDDLIARLGHERSVEVVAKTLAKMSERGREVALGLPLSEAGAAVVREALAPG
ncbi:MAG: DUF4202 domain-containing protein [Acidimicrobiia bacterium]|nr:DUF4202 domain-containing protein [Acidimicrobiia bacterium]